MEQMVELLFFLMMEMEMEQRDHGSKCLIRFPSWEPASHEIKIFKIWKKKVSLGFVKRLIQ